MHLTNRVGVIIAGVQKGATTSLHHALKAHTQIHTAARKELDYWNYANSKTAQTLNYSTAQYNSLFPTTFGRKKILLDSTPHYILDAGVPARVLAYNPSCKFIINLRNPIHRMLSAYRMCSHNYAKQNRQIESGRIENRSLANIIAYELDLIHSNGSIDKGLHPQYQRPYYIPQSLYSNNIERFVKQVPRENLLINIIEEDLYPNSQSYITNIQHFLGLELEPLTMPVLNATKKDNDTLMSELFDIFKQDIRSLEAIINRNLDCWNI